MAASAPVDIRVDIRSELAEFWDGFQRAAQARVAECNVLAEELLWSASPAGSAALFAVRSAACPEDSLECSFDFEQGILTCKPGPAIQAETLEFQVVDSRTALLRRNGSGFSMEQAVAVILDELVWVEE